MSVHASEPVAPVPVPAHEPPYYAVVFTSVRRFDKASELDSGQDSDKDAGDYQRTAARLSRLVRDIPGFLGEDFAHSPGGLAISVAYFRDLDGIERWRRHPEHLGAKRLGRDRWFEQYVLHIAKVEQAHGFAGQ
ncbi:antibiotic biosynthesis monooxygenase family protein [Streptomyces sp. MMG1121]|uniref:antibiotic biosynthesis monooxygenase family protein n=1 Tax=Streptomyces sp. MMG1121 TaxID=1415544 RepID=UPI0006AF2CD1|nr:antibiotic biosynthesis monooxygenase [Streptomyces sp. MMG1121]KOV60036.1 hypothetical protein ADK64_32210 [Streptomyces sp. MMG1121]